MFLNLGSVSQKMSRYAVMLLLMLILVPPFAAASDIVHVKDIRYWSSPDYTRVVIDLSGPVDFSQNSLSNPDRIYFDLTHASIPRDIKTTFPVGDGILKSIRASQYNEKTVRVVLDIETLSDSRSFVIENPARLVVDLYGKQKPVEKQDIRSARRRIVIDPGHGGHDPGAVGPKKLYEKDVVLDIALKLKEILMKDPLNEVFLTREKDIYIPLEERTVIANRKNADLFVSIHANASPKSTAKGIETYLLNWTDDEEAMRVAARENAISLKRMKAMQRQMDVVEIIKSDLMRENKRDESIRLANYIQKSLVTNLGTRYQHVVDLGVKQALFYVLFGAKMPSVLVEVSFISNPQEEFLLSKDSYRSDIARAIADGLGTYVTSAPVIQKMADTRENRRFYR
ncbi:MAG: N-acetylmuramoyl-L-alanine amidase [Nitrospirota bacterium]